MTSSIMDIERLAVKLRRCLSLAYSPELRLICGLRFFGLIDSLAAPKLESYVREFSPVLATTAGRSNPREFLPEDSKSLTGLIELLKTQKDGVVSPDDLKTFEHLGGLIGVYPEGPVVSGGERKHATHLTCLFVEHYPDLDLPPRGRILDLSVMASPISSKVDQDDIAVRNPVAEPDDHFLAQARRSVKAGRAYVFQRYGLPLKKRYRFDLAVEAAGVRFTGDSLGVAFAVGAIVALSKVEVFRERPAVSPQAAFSGALTADGKVAPIDAEALKLKIYRAFHSGLQLLVIPRDHLTAAWAHVRALEEQFPDRKLELVGGDTLDAILADPRLLPVERSSAPAYAARKIFHARRSIWVEVPVLVTLLAVLFYLVAPVHMMPWFDDNPAFAITNPDNNSLDVYNRDSLLLWADTISCPFSKSLGRITAPTSFGKVHDLNDDGVNEVIFQPPIDGNCDERSWIRFYSFDGKLRFKRYCALIGKSSIDTVGVLYDPTQFYIEKIGGEIIIVTTVAAELPARLHIRFWNAQGDSLGWYINRGHGQFVETIDLDADFREELLFVGFNNNMGCTALLVIKPDSAFGFSPIREGADRDPRWPREGSQMAYILFPVSDVGRVPGELPSGRNQMGPSMIQISDKGHLKVYISESTTTDFAPQLIYFLDYNLRVERVVLNDYLINRRNLLVGEGKLPAIEDMSAYVNAIRDAVTYWSDSGWITEGQLRAADNLE